MIKKGDKVSWKVAGFPDATGIAIEDELDGVVTIDDSDGEEGGMICLEVSKLTVIG